MRVASYQLLMLLTLSSSAGCSLWGETAPTDYRTVVESPMRDTGAAKTLNRDAISHFERGNILKAEQTVQQALVADVSFGPAHNTLGKVYFHQQKYYLAAWEFEYATKAMPEHPEPLNNLGLVYEEVGKLDEAVAAFEEAHAMAPDEPQFLGNLLRVRLRRNDTDEEMIPMLQHLALLDPRAEWQHWATGQVHYLRSQTATRQSLQNAHTNDTEPPEELPPPDAQLPYPENTLPGPTITPPTPTSSPIRESPPLR